MLKCLSIYQNLLTEITNLELARFKARKGLIKMVCFEYDKLYKEDFLHAVDFEFLITQDFPCLQVQYKHGHLHIHVRHYLAVIAMPSGDLLEILPKVAADTRFNPIDQGSSIIKRNQNQKHQINQTRLWVRTMLADTLGKIVAHPLDTVSFGVMSERGQPQWHLSTSDELSDNLSWYMWLSELYIKQLESLRSIMPREYKTQQHNSPQASGKLNIKAQIKQNWHRPHYIASEQVSLKDYQLLWQFLSTAYRQISFTNNSNSQINKLHDSDLISRLTMSEHLPVSKWHSSYVTLLQDMQLWRQQLNSTQLVIVQQAIEWAWWLLQPSLEIFDGVGEQSYPHTSQIQSAFMLNMNHLFEQWVGVNIEKWRQKNLNKSRLISQPNFDWLAIQTQSSTNDAHKNINLNTETYPKTRLHNSVIQRLRPDYCIVDFDNTITHVIEVKYKQLDNLSHISASDLYQLCVYQQQLQATHAWIIYPKSSGLRQRSNMLNVALPIYNDINSTIKSLGDNAQELNAPENNENQLSDKVETTLSVLPFCVHQSKLLI